MAFLLKTGQGEQTSEQIDDPFRYLGWCDIQDEAIFKRSVMKLGRQESAQVRLEEFTAKYKLARKRIFVIIHQRL